MESIIVPRGNCRSYDFSMVYIDLNSKASIEEIREVVKNAAGAMRLQLIVDFHFQKDIHTFLDVIDIQAREKGLEISLKIPCTCEECEAKRNAVCDSVRWMSRWDT